jgi:proteasome lid subunit RPN8/RPN11
MFNQKVLNDIRKHVLSQLPLEACGLVIDNTYYACKNVADKPKDDFLIHPEEQLNLLSNGPIQAVIHSHINQKVRTLSEADMVNQQKMKIPWGVVFVNNGVPSPVIFFGDEVPIVPLEKREFIFGIYDCWTLIKDYYKLNRNVVLRNAPRDWEWWVDTPEKDFYSLDNAHEQGFTETSVGELQEGDLVLGHIHSKVVNHGGIYIGQGLILHHLAGRYSRKEPIGPWIKFIRHYLHYVGN